MPLESNRSKSRKPRVARLVPGWPALLIAAVVLGPWMALHAAEPAPEAARLRNHVETLASPEFAGRQGAGARKAATYIIDAFRALKLEPLFDGAFEQAIPGEEPDQVIGRNVGARLVGSDPELKDEWIILSAHFDHLGVRNGVLYPGADDNASGVAMMLEVARAIVESGQPTKRSLMFVGFDLEENGLWGSRYFAEHPPVPLDRVGLFLTADMIARSLGGVCDPYVFVMGSEHAPGLRDWIEQAGQGLPVKVGVVGSDLLFFDRSDYGPFRLRKVPYLFFSTGENPRYHTPDDTPDTLDYPKFAANCELIHRIVVQAAGADRLPTWAAEPDNPFAEVLVIHDVLRILLGHREALGVKPLQAAWIEGQMKILDAILERGSVTPAERRKMVRGAQLVLYSVL